MHRTAAPCARRPDRASIPCSPRGHAGVKLKLPKKYSIWSRSPTPILTSQFPPDRPKGRFPSTSTRQRAAPCAAPCVSGCSVLLPDGVRGRQTKIANHLLDVEPPNRFSPTRAFTSILPILRLNLALLVANVPVASPRVPNSLSVCWRAARRFLNLHRLSTRALRSTWTRFGAFR